MDTLFGGLVEVSRVFRSSYRLPFAPGVDRTSPAFLAMAGLMGKTLGDTVG